NRSLVESFIVGPSWSSSVADRWLGDGGGRATLWVVPSLRTEITEITTGLAMLGLGDLDWALAARPEELVGVDDAGWDRLATARTGGAHDADFHRAWDNGLAFLRASEGLRGRVPARIEWKGPDRLPLVSDVP